MNDDDRKRLHQRAALQLRRLAMVILDPTEGGLQHWEATERASDLALAALLLDPIGTSIESVPDVTPHMPTPVATAGRPRGAACVDGGRHRYNKPTDGTAPKCLKDGCGHTKGAAAGTTT